MISYTFGSDAYRNSGLPVMPVTPVRPVERLQAHPDRLTRVESGLSDKADEKILSKYAESTKAEYDITNPYESAKMTSESTALIGMNFDWYA